MMASNEELPSVLTPVCGVFKNSKCIIKYRIFAATPKDLEVEVFLKWLEYDDVLYHHTFSANCFKNGNNDSWENILQRIQHHFPDHVNMHCTSHRVTLVYESVISYDFYLELAGHPERGFFAERYAQLVANFDSIVTDPVGHKTPDSTNTISMMLSHDFHRL